MLFRAVPFRLPALRRRALGTAVALVLVARDAHAAPLADPPPDFDPSSTAQHPCGAGVPQPGHPSPDLRPSPGGTTLIVRQDGSRLCYVSEGSADAPVLRVRQGSDLTITLRNEISDPTRIDAVTTPGKLRTPNEGVPRTPGFYEVVPGMRHGATGTTNLHLHGFAVPPVAPQDDVMTVCTDPASGTASCGRREFTYRFHIPADMPEGLYWYHPHVHGEVQAQMLMGLSGAIVVDGPLDDARRALGIGERVLIARQVQDQDSGRTPDAAMTAAMPMAEGPPSPAGSDVVASQIDTAHELLCTTNSGIDQISLNGTPVPVGDAPDSALAHLDIAAGRKELWRILNAATDAFLDLALVDESGRPLPLEVVARDGAALTDDSGRLLRSVPTTASQAVPPAGRLEVLVGAPPPGVKAYLVTHAVDTGCAGDRVPERRLAFVTAEGAAVPIQPAATIRAAASTQAAASTRAAVSARTPKARPTTFSGLLARRTDARRVIAMAEYPRPGSTDQTDFYIAERQSGRVLKPYEMGDPPAITVRAGTTEEWVIENWTNELHAFHIHQVHFRVLEVDGQPVTDPPLLDVVTVPYASATGYRSKEGPVRPGRVRIKLYFPQALAGDIPFHCHLVDHEDNGMMAVLRVLSAHRRR
jgi:FtsP/CotA-like multicopper oxidase with cupredoxin domain